jgi:hypothetical protein
MNEQSLVEKLKRLVRKKEVKKKFFVRERGSYIIKK